MTREEAIECNKNLRMHMKLSDKNQPCKFLAENYIALDMAIKALEQKPVLDKITKIIEPLRHLSIDEMSGIEWDILRAIDKYKAESEIEE